MNARIITARFIDWLLSTHEDSLNFIGLEVRFSLNNRRADIFMLDEYIIAYEIKSELDSLDKLETQMKDYIKCFNQVWLITVDKHIEKARTIIPQSVGLILYTDNTFKIIRKGKPRVRLSSQDLLHSIPVSWLKYETKFKGNCAYTIRQNINNQLSGLEIFNLWQKWLRNNYEQLFYSFKTYDRGEITHTEDLYRLSSRFANIS